MNKEIEVLYSMIYTYNIHFLQSVNSIFVCRILYNIRVSLKLHITYFYSKLYHSSSSVFPTHFVLQCSCAFS